MPKKTVYVHYSLDKMFQRRVINHEQGISNRERIAAAPPRADRISIKKAKKVWLTARRAAHLQELKLAA